ncbi:sugar nucleotide-binding protein [Pelagibacteraceae bacterium]|nr:sugar nucleotide-binding protein [Pelagibacteraceae bacterium]
MLLYKNKILITGGSGRFGQVLRDNSFKYKYEFLFPTKKELDILQPSSIEKYILKKKPKYLMHLAGLSRPMEMHDTYISESIDKNIIGTANITKICFKYKIKLIYVSTCYVYPGIKGSYHEDDPLLPINNYAWSKLGGESSVQMYKNSLILRASITEKPFVHQSAFVDFKTNFIFHEDLIPGILKIIDKKGVVNIGGKSQSVYNFAKKYDPKIKKIKAKKLLGKSARINLSMNINKFKKIINQK